MRSIKILGFLTIFFIISFLLASPLFADENLTIASLVSEARAKGEDASLILATDLFLKSADAEAHGNNQTAIALLRYTRELTPNDDYLKRKLSVMLIHNGARDEAKKILETAYLESHQKNVDVGLILAGLYVTLEKTVEARNIYHHIISLNSNNEDACSYFAKFYSIEKKATPKDQEFFNKCEKKNKTDSAYPFYRGLKAQVAGHLTKAETFFKKSLKMNPTYSDAVWALGDLYEKKSDLKSAVKIYKDFLSTEGNNTNSAVLNRIATDLISMKNNRAAIPYLETLNLIDNNDLNLKARLALLYSDTDRFSEAVNLFNEVLVAAPESDKVIYYLGLLNQKIYHYQEAIGFFNRIPASSEFSDDAKLQVINMNIKMKENFGHEASLQPKKDNAASVNK